MKKLLRFRIVRMVHNVQTNKSRKRISSSNNTKRMLHNTCGIIFVNMIILYPSKWKNEGHERTKTVLKNTLKPSPYTLAQFESSSEKSTRTFKRSINNSRNLM